MDQVSEVREKIDIVSFIAEFITIKKAGRNFKANCPFHGEKTPSFVVSPERQIWHCFGCNRGGDCYSFLMQYEHIEFPEALRILAKRAGIELVSARFDSPITSKKEKIYKLNALAAEFYHFLLTKHNAGKRALSYLETRGVTDKLIKTFKIGFAPYIGTALTDYLLKKKKYPLEELMDAGLATMRGRYPVDFFSGRIMFPLVDHRDNTVGFSGRAIDDRTYGPKYINTRETLAYHKGDMFFGLATAKEAMKKQNQALLVEGEFDVISCFKEGITNTIAIKGTALTEQQVKLLSRFVKKVTMCFDIDTAGQEAMKRSLTVLEPQGLTTTVVVIPNGKDPDEAIKKDPYAFKAAIRDDIPIYDYLLEQELKKVDPTSMQGKKTVADALIPQYSHIENEIVKEHYLKKLSKVLDTTYESIQKEAERLQRREIAGKRHIEAPKVKRTRDEILEEYLVALLIQAERIKEVVLRAETLLSDTLSLEKASQKILSALFAYCKTHETVDGKTFGNTLPEELHEAYDRSFLFPLTTMSVPEKYMQEVERVAKELRGIYIRQQMKKLALEIGKNEKEGAATDSLKETYSYLASKLQK